MRASTWWLAWSLALGLGVGACSGGSDGSESAASPAPTESQGTPEASLALEKGPQQSVVRVELEQGGAPGVVITADGYILTSADVGGEEGPVQVTFGDGNVSEATVAGSDSQSRLAVLKVDVAADLTPAVFGASEAVQVDDEVQFLGGPGPGRSVVGAVRATDSIVDGSIMIEVGFDPDATTSSGPLVNGDGEVVGILMAIGTAIGDDDQVKIGYAVPSDAARRITDQLIESGQVTRPYLGTQVRSADSAGALVHEVVAGSPANQAGVQAGDVITQLGDLPVAGPDELVAAVRSGRVGDEVTLTLTRDDTERELTVVLGQAPAADSPQ